MEGGGARVKEPKCVVHYFLFYLFAVPYIDRYIFLLWTRWVHISAEDGVDVVDLTVTARDKKKKTRRDVKNIYIYRVDREVNR